MLPLAFALACAAQAPAVEAESRPKLLVLAFRDNGLGANAVDIVSDTLATHLAADARLDVTSTDELRRLMELQAVKIEMSCDDDSCMSEIAEALGAQLTVHGTAGRLGDLVVVNVSLFDARAGASIGREVIEVGSVEELPGPLRAAGDRLVARLGLPPTAAADVPSVNGLLIASATVAGVGLAVGAIGAAMWLPNIEGYADDESNPSFTDKQASRQAEQAGAALAAGGLAALAVGAVMVGVALALE